MDTERQTIYLCLAHMSEAGLEQKYVKEAFDTNWVVPMGPNVNAFEHDLEAFANSKSNGTAPLNRKVVCLSAGTAAVHLALIGCGVKAGDEVLVQSFTFCASSHPVTYLGAKPVFVGSEGETWNMDPALLEKAIIDRQQKTGKLPKAIVPVALYGMPYRIGEIMDIANRYGIPVVEDAAEGMGSRYNGQVLGTFGRYGVLSFNGNKMITTSGGGALICRNADEANNIMWYATQARDAYPYYQHTAIGYNYRMSNITAGIGRGQMKVLPLRVQQKQAIFARYCEKLRGLPLTMQPKLDCAQPNRWLSVLLLDANCGVTPAELLARLNEANIEGRHLWKPMSLQPVFAGSPFVRVSDAPVCDDLFARGVCLPSDTKMSMDDVDRVCEVIRGMF